jgi:hypothetical protein
LDVIYPRRALIPLDIVFLRLLLSGLAVLLPRSLRPLMALIAAWLLEERITRGPAIGLALIVSDDMVVGGAMAARASV